MYALGTRCLSTMLAIAFALSIGLVTRNATGAEALPPELSVVHKIQVGGLERSYRLFVPSTNGTTPLPVVFAFHGGGATSKSMVQWTRFHKIGAREGFMVVYPDGSRRGRLGGGSWNVGSETPQTPAEKAGIDDLVFIRALLEHLKSRYKIDPHRIYATGMSLGAIFSYHLACHMSETFAAVAIVAGTMASATCPASAPVAILVIHGIEDQFVPISGGHGKFTAKGRSWPPVDRGLRFWRSRNGCQENRERDLQTSEATCWTYAPCSRQSSVEYCSVEGGHHWPGQERPLFWQRLLSVKITTFPADDRIWAFFKANAKQN